MANRIVYSLATPWGAQVAEFAATVVKAQQLAGRIVDTLNSMAAGGAGPFTTMESEMGMTAGAGTLLYTVLNDAKVNLAAVGQMNTIDMGE